MRFFNIYRAVKLFISLSLSFALLWTFTACALHTDAQEDIFDIVEKNYDTILKACEESDLDTLSAIKGITKAELVDGYVIVYCKGAGIAPSSQDYGFYYSPTNSPVAVDCNLDIVCNVDKLTPEENGYKYVADGNTFYTQHIKGNFYFYSNAY